MQVSLENQAGLKRRITIEVPADKVAGLVDNHIQKLLPTLRVDGFRTGKVPFKVAKQRVGDKVLVDVANDLVQETLFKALEQEDVTPAGLPSIEFVELAQDKPFKYIAHFEVFPEFTVNDISDAELTQYQVDITPADIDRVLQNLRKQHATYQDTDRACQDTDQVIMDFAGTIDGEPMEKGQATDFQLTLGAGNMIAGFEEGIIGHKAGDEFTLSLTFPEDYHAAEVAGKPVEFAIKLKAVQGQILPEVNEEFAKTINLQSADEIEAQLQRHLSFDLQQRLETKHKDQAFQALLAKHSDVDVPESLVHEEIHRMQADFAKQFKMDIDFKKFPEELFRDRATERVKLGLLVNQFIKQHDMEATDEEIDAELERYASFYEKPEEFLQWHKENPEQRQQMKHALLERKVVEKLFAQAKVIAEPMDYETLVNPPKASEETA